MRQVPLDALVQALRAIPPGDLVRERVLREIGGVVLEPASLQPYRHFVPGRYTRNLVYRDDLLEVLVLCWGSGDRTPIHNHDNQLGWMTVQEGALSLTNFRRVSCGMGGPGEDPWRCGAGSQAPVILEEISSIDVASVGAVTTVDRQETIHRIANLPGFGGPAMSLHVYSRPIDSCVIYDPERGTCQRVALSYYSVQGRIVHGAEQPDRALR